MPETMTPLQVEIIEDLVVALLAARPTPPSDSAAGHTVSFALDVLQHYLGEFPDTMDVAVPYDAQAMVDIALRAIKRNQARRARLGS